MRWDVGNLARCVAAISLVIAVAACGGGDDAAEQTDAGFDAASSEEAAAAEVDASAEGLVARWGGEGAFFVVFRANDLGYRTRQIVDAADTIAADGTIPGVAPEGEPLGMLTELPDVEQQSLRRAASPVAAAGPADEAGDDIPKDAYIGSVDRTLAEVHTAAQEAADRAEARDAADEEVEVYVIMALQKLGMQGYSGPQIIEAILLFDASVYWGDTFLESNCHVAIRSGDGWLKPAFPPADELGCEPAWIEDPDGDLIKEPDDEPIPETTDASVTPAEGDPTLHGRYEGELDFAAAYAAVAPEVAAVLTVSENVVVADVDEGRLVSLTGALHTYNPEIVLDGGGICEADARLWFEADVGSATSTDDGFEVSVQWSSYEKTGDCGGFSPTEDSETGVALAVGRIDQETGGLSLEIEFFPDFVFSGLLTATSEGTATPPPAPNPTVTTTTTTLAAPGFQFIASESSTSDGRFRGERRANWSGAYSTQDGVIAGSGTVSGSIDGECRDSSDAPFGPVSLTLSGSYRITGTVSEGAAKIRLITDPAVVDLAVGDTSKECVQSVMRLGETTAQFPIGSSSPGGLALELPAQGGSTTLVHPSGKVIEVSVSPLG